MLRSFLHAKIRDVRITSTNPDYEGSITIDQNYLEKAGILPNESVDVVNACNGERFRTYVIKGKRGSGIVELNGPAARLGMPGDRIMVLAYALLDEGEIAAHRPAIVSAEKPARRAQSRRRRGGA